MLISPHNYVQRGASVGDPCLMPGHDSAKTTTWVIFQEPFLTSQVQPAGRVCPWILSSLQCSTSVDEQTNYVMWITPWFGAWINSKVTVCLETSPDYCEMFLSFSVSQPHGACLVTEGNLRELDAILWWLELVNTDCKCQDYIEIIGDTNN